MLRTGAINLVLKVGLMLSSIVFAIMSFVQGTTIIQYYPDFLINLIGESATLILGSLVALCLALWLLSRRQRFAAVTSYLVLLTVGILFNLTSLSFLGMVWPLWCISFALSLRYYPRIRVLAKDSHGRHVMKIIPAATAAIIASDQDLGSNSISKETHKETRPKTSTPIYTPQADTSTVINTSTPAFSEEDEKSDVANKHSANTVVEYEMTHDVEATIEEIFSHAGLIQTDSAKDESLDDIIGETYSTPASPHIHSFTPTTIATTPETPKRNYTQSQETETLNTDELMGAKSIKRPRISRINKKDVSETPHVSKSNRTTATPMLSEEPIVPLGEVISIEENPRIAKKRARAKSVQKSRVKKTTETGRFVGENEIEDIQ